MYLLLLWIVMCLIFVPVSTSQCKCTEGITTDYALFDGEMISGDIYTVCVCCYNRYKNTFIKFQQNNRTVCRVYNTYSKSTNSQKYECGRRNYTSYLIINDVSTEDDGDWLCRGTYNPGYRKHLVFTANPQSSRFWRSKTSTSKWTPNYMSVSKPQLTSTDATNNINPQLLSTDATNNINLQLTSTDATDNIKPQLLSTDATDNIKPQLLSRDATDNIKPQLLSRDATDNINLQLPSTDATNNINPQLTSTDATNNINYQIISPETVPGIPALAAHGAPYISTVTSVICITVVVCCSSLMLISTVFFSTQYFKCFKRSNYTGLHVRYSENRVYQDLLSRDDQDTSRNSSASPICSNTDHHYQSIGHFTEQHKINSSQKGDHDHSHACSSALLHSNTLKRDAIAETLVNPSQTMVGDILKVVADNIHTVVQQNVKPAHLKSVDPTSCLPSKMNRSDK